MAKPTWRSRSPARLPSARRSTARTPRAEPAGGTRPRHSAALHMAQHRGAGFRGVPSARSLPGSTPRRRRRRWRSRWRCGRRRPHHLQHHDPPVGRRSGAGGRASRWRRRGPLISALAIHHLRNDTIPVLNALVYRDRAHNIKISSSIAFAAVLCSAFAGPALAEKDATFRRGGASDKTATQTNHSNDARQVRGPTRHDTNQATTPGGVVAGRSRTGSHPYQGKRLATGNCPPGLANKNNGCLPPGQAN